LAAAGYGAASPEVITVSLEPVAEVSSDSLVITTVAPAAGCRTPFA
jgi:hypothetical protein